MALNIEHLHRVHCIGVGGIGVSAAAKFLRLQGKEVSGSDAKPSDITAEAAKAGVNVLPEDAANIRPDLDLVIYTPAAPEDHPERVAAAKLGIAQLSYPEFLGLLSLGYETVAVCGTNGKSTTTALLGLMLEAAGLDPLVIVGSKVTSFPYGNLRPGKGKILVVEACEYRDGLLNLSPTHVVVTNIAHDHPDHFRDLDHVVATFQAFVDKIPEGGTLALNADDPVSTSKLKPKGRMTTFGFAENAGLKAGEVENAAEEQRFDIRESASGETWESVIMRVPGRFNVENALAAATVARALGASEDAIRQVLAAFTGIWRRFERVGRMAVGAELISDYGHHPDAVRGTLAAARDFFPGRRVVLAFQPHHHERTKKLFDGFVESFDGADALVLAEIYGVTGRLESADEVSSRELLAAIEKRDTAAGKKRQLTYAADPEAALAETKRLAEKGDVVIVMGAGDLYLIIPRLLS
jgi:UDP-N-acetylmuramate--alanine ligase